MKAAEANVRRGPSKSHRIDWVFKHRHMPLIVTGEYGHWRRVQDRDGFGGWVHYVLLSGSRSVIIETEEEPLRRKPLEDSPIVAYAQEGVIARLKECSGDWCRITAGKRTGWVKADALWGVSITDAMLGE
ncbi:MAG: SH3 domain-containing protein, partial [Mangrovicoccus sp.]